MKPFPYLALLGLVLTTPLTWSAEPSPERLPRSTPEEQGISSAAILRYVDALEARVMFPHSFMLVRHGHVVAEGWWTPYAATEPHTLFSLSKSFTSIAMGLAVNEGKLTLADPVLKHFPAEAPTTPSRNLQAMRVRDLLRMASGHHGEDVDPFPYDSDQNLVRLFLAKPVAHKPGTHFYYNTAGTFMLSAILQKAAGETVHDYLMPRLFQPLGMGHPRWDSTATGTTLGGYGLSLRTEDIACFGLLLLQRGNWQGRQLVPATWIDEATALQTATGSDPAGNWDQGYGYQFWRTPHGYYRGDGAFGQLCLVMPEHDAVLVMTAGTDELGPEFDLPWEFLLPAFQSAALPADPESVQRLTARLENLRLPTQTGQPSSPVAAAVAKRLFVFPTNTFGLESITLLPSSDDTGATVECKLAGIDQRVFCGLGAWVKGVLRTPNDQIGLGDLPPVAASGAWTADDTYTAKLVRYRTPFTLQLQLKFSEDSVTFDLEQDLYFGKRDSIHLTGFLSPPISHP
jgi:CubicO group peptidase (beta-lactamase class C family)